MANSKPTKEHELPQGRKNWDKPPQQVDGPSGPKPSPLPVDAGAGETNSKKKPQQVNGPKGPELVDWPPRGHETNSRRKPQQVDGPEGPEATDGTELIQAATGQLPGGKGGKMASTAKDSGKADSTQTQKDAATSEAEAKEKAKVQPKAESKSAQAKGGK